MAPTTSLRPPLSALIVTCTNMVGVSLLGFAFLLLPTSTLLSTPPFPAFEAFLHPEGSQLLYSAAVDPSTTQFQHLAGVITIAIGMGYATSLWYKQYEYVYQSVPPRLLIAATTFLTLLVRPERVNGILLFIGVTDGLGALMMGYFIGYTGKVPESAKIRAE